MKRSLAFVLFFISVSCFSQADTAKNAGCDLRISLLTCTPGKELYSTFGHSALRVIDKNNGTDLIFNYGTFDFNDPDFYKKFIRGKLLYFVSIDNFADFVNDYRFEERGIIEQTLNLSCAEKQNLVGALYENAKEENKYYKYDFVYDNCTTRLRDIVAKYCGDSLINKNILPYKRVTFRNLIHEYLNKGGEYWSKLGIDLLLGSPLDKKISNKEAMFLPDYLLKGFDSTTINGNPLVAEKKNILDFTPFVIKKKIFTPLPVAIFLFVVIALLGFIRNEKAKTFFKIFDGFFFFLCGALGIWLFFMWFGTDHPTCKNNYNLLWALPSHFFVAFVISKKWKWLKYYFLANAVLLLLLSCLWEWLPQELNTALIPIIALLILRSLVRYKEIGSDDGKKS